MKRITNQVVALLMKRWYFVLGIAALTTLVTVLFLGKGQDVWFDENYSIILAKQSVGELLRLTGVDAHPPLFYLLLKAWGSIFGWTELSLRFMSASLAALTVVMVAFLIRKLFSVRVSLVALPFIVAAPFWLRYGYEIRMYALAGFIGAAASFVLLKAVEKKANPWWWVFYALLVALGTYTLYMTVILWFAHFVWLVMYRRQRIWRQPWVWAYVAAAVSVLPYLPTVIFQYTHSALPGIGWTLNLTHIFEVISMVLIYTPEWSVAGWSALLILLIIGLSLYLIDRVRHAMTASLWKSFMFLACIVFVPPLLFALVSVPMSQPFFVPRYLAHVIIFTYALLGVIVALGWQYGYRKAALLLGIASLTALMYGVSQLSQAGNFNFERMQRPQTFQVRQQIGCDKSVVVADDAYTYINNEYYFGDCDVRFYSDKPLVYWGGYAYLSGSEKRLAASTDLTTSRLVHLYWNNQPAAFHPDDRYRRVSSVIHDQQVTDTYELKAN